MLSQLAAAAAVVSVAIQFVLFLRWLHRRMRDDEITRHFVRDVATVHLPHIYQVLGEIAEFNGINVNPPPIQFVDFSNGRKRGAS